MCGFIFIFNKSKNQMSSKKINYISGFLKHRGPDDKQIFSNNEISTVFFRLSIRDISNKGRQPYISKSKRYIMCFNGEIYNVENLKKKLKNKNFQGTSDTEVLAQSFDELGLKSIEYIEGMFSIILYDFHKKIFYAIRDRLGIKPLYYTEDDNHFIFSSEIKPLIVYSNKNKTLNQISLRDFFLKGYLSHNQNTFFRNINSIEPGHLMIYSKNIKIKKYFEIIEPKEKKITAQNLNNKIYNTVSKHLISDRKIGLFLSGGTDSKALAKYIYSKLNTNFTTFTYDFQDFEGETFKAKQISKELNIKNYNTIVTPNYIIENFDKLIKKVEMPITSIRLFGINKLYEIAKKNNINVILEGHGGDEMLGGYEYNYYPYLMDFFNNNKKLVKKYILKSFSRTILQNYERSFTSQGLSTSDGVPFFEKNFFNKDFISNKRFGKAKIFPDLNNLKNSQLKDILFIKLPRVLQYTDRISMSYGIEARVPFLDHNLFKECVNLSNRYKFRNNVTRWILRKIFEEKTNNQNYFETRKKTIVDPQKDWFRTSLKDFVFDNLNSSDLKKIGIFNQKYILKYFDNYLKNGSVTSFNLMQVLSFYRFYKIFILDKKLL